MNQTTKRISSVLLTLAATVWVAGCVAGPETTDESDEEGASEDIGQAEQPLISCSGEGCNGLDPNLTTCASSAITVASKTVYRNGTNIKLGTVEMRYSTTCKTNWSRVTRTDGAYAEAMVAKIVRVTDGKNYMTSKTGQTSIWSPMVYGYKKCTYAWGDIDISFSNGTATTATVC